MLSTCYVLVIGAGKGRRRAKGGVPELTPMLSLKGRSAGKGVMCGGVFWVGETVRTRLWRPRAARRAVGTTGRQDWQHN